jgi:hypothetical protein
MSRRGAAAFGLAAVGAATLWVAACTGARSEGERAGGAPVAVQAGKTPALDPRTRGWEAGKRYAYRLKSTTAVSFGGGVNAFDFDLMGNVAIAVVAVGSDSVTLHASITDTTSVSRVPGTQAEFDRLAAEIGAAGCFFELRGGRVSEMRLAKGQPAMVANAFRELGSALQFAHAVGDSSRYTAEEYDSTGQYVAEYERRGERLWHKKKQRYLGMLVPKTVLTHLPVSVVPEVTLSKGEVRLSPQGRPESVTMQNGLTIDGAQAPVRSKSVLTLESKAADQGAPPQDWQARLAAAERVRADEPYGSGASIESLDDARIRGTTFEAVVSRLEERARAKRPQAPSDAAAADKPDDVGETSSVNEDSQLFSALSALLRKEPSAVEKAGRKIRERSPASAALVDALGSASSSSSQQTLLALMKSEQADSDLKLRVLFSLSRSGKPTEASIAFLKSVATTPGDRGSKQALYGLGTYARKLRDDGEREQARRIGEFLLERLERARGQISVVTALRAVGNAGYAEALPRVAPYLTDKRELVRVAAARALQSMKNPEIDGMLAARIQNDDSSDVRISAIAAAQVREPSDVLGRALKDAATVPDPRVRYRAVELMRFWLDRRPDFRTVLERVALNDSEARVRELAKTSL